MLKIVFDIWFVDMSGRKPFDKDTIRVYVFNDWFHVTILYTNIIIIHDGLT